LSLFKNRNRSWLQRSVDSIDGQIVATTALALGATAAVGAGVYWAATRRAPRATFRMRREIDAPPERVLEWFATPEQRPEPRAHAGVDAEGDLTWKQSGPFGFTYTWTPRVDIDAESREVRWSSDEEALVDARGRVRVRPTHDGKSLLEFTTDFQVPGPIWPKMLHERTRNLVAEDLERVCIALESEAQGQKHRVMAEAK